eukprot:1191382-Prorocentrum_minimum.AAC.2
MRWLNKVLTVNITVSLLAGSVRGENLCEVFEVQVQDGFGIVPSGICEASAILASILFTMSSCRLLRNMPDEVRILLETLPPL